MIKYLLAREIYIHLISCAPMLPLLGNSKKRKKNFKEILLLKKKTSLRSMPTALRPEGTMGSVGSCQVVCAQLSIELKGHITL